MSHLEIINRWPSLGDFASDLGVAYGTAKAMRRRGKVPAEYWCRLVERAREREIDGVHLDVLADAIAREAAE